MKLETWECGIDQFSDLANPVVIGESPVNIMLRFEDLRSKAKYVIRFMQVLGYRFEDNFGQRRMGSTFQICDSAWIAEMKRKPFRIKNLDGAKHFLISTMNGQFEVVTTEDPVIEVVKHGSN